MSNQMSNDAQQYEKNGYAKLEGWHLSEAMVMKINEDCDRIAASGLIDETMFEENHSGKIKQIQELHKKSETCAGLIDQAKKVAAELNGLTPDDYELLNMQMFEKHPGISKPTRLHQDNAYFKYKDGNKTITFWIAMDEIDEENGALYYAPGTHRLPTLNHDRFNPSTTFRVRCGVPGLSLCLREYPEEVCVPMLVKPGDVLVHHCNTIHHAGKNKSKDRRRRAIGIVLTQKGVDLDPRLMALHQERLSCDIKLQQVRDPEMYERFKHLI